jgi:YVTN family beta-propeller protein
LHILRVFNIQSVIFAAACLSSAAEFHAPAGDRYALATSSGSILPGGRILKPLGTEFETGPGPFGLAVSHNGTVVTADIGFARSGVTIIEPPGKGPRRQHHLWARTPLSTVPESADPEWKGVFTGIVFESDKSVWVSEGDSGKVRQIDITSYDQRKLVALNTPEAPNSYTGDLAYESTRRLLYVLDQTNSRMVVIDAKTGRVAGSAPVGRMPFAIALSPDGFTAWVANTGIFRYQPLPKPGLPFPAFGFPSPEALKGTSDAPGLGDPNARESNSVCVIDVRDPRKPEVTDWIRTSSPQGVLATAERVYVSNARADSITVISARDRRIVGEIPLRIPSLEQFRGIMPGGMAYDPVTKWLLVAETGLNAVGIIDTETNESLGHIPAGWMPTRVAISGDRVYVANARGRGAGPNLRRPLRDLGEAPSLHRGSVTTFIMPDASELLRHTGTVFSANGFVPDMRDAPKTPDAIRHVVVIVKENRTFDELLGDVKAATGPVAALGQLARFGMRGRADGHRAQFSVQDAPITPNHRALAQGWTFSDNFYADGEGRVDGHHWLTGAAPDLPTQAGLLAAYGGHRSFAGTHASTHPEEQPEAGTLWHHLERHGVSFRSFGEGFDLADSVEDSTTPTGVRFLTNVPMPDPLYRNTSREYPGFNMNIPDQYRADRFIAEVDSRYGKGGEPFPRFIWIHLPNDHLADARPQDGYPYEASFMEDNDLALGRILEYLSHSPWWREMAVFVTEADAQGGLDHIDAHRTLLLAAGPYVKRNYVSHTNTSFPGLLRTIFELLGVPPLHLADATSASLRDVWAGQPDFTPFTAIAPDRRIFDPAKVKRYPN